MMADFVKELKAMGFVVTNDWGVYVSFFEMGEYSISLVCGVHETQSDVALSQEKYNLIMQNGSDSLKMFVNTKLEEPSKTTLARRYKAWSL